ncbi:hypothetical protein HQ489_01115 [Candidatus Woesearchaeota archaeon]|nr:hypothetical protein [Candidatus Woesearchaeota archaeon]
MINYFSKRYESPRHQIAEVVYLNGYLGQGDEHSKIIPGLSKKRIDEIRVDKRKIPLSLNKMLSTTDESTLGDLLGIEVEENSHILVSLKDDDFGVADVLIGRGYQKI